MIAGSLLVLAVAVLMVVSFTTPREESNDQHPQVARSVQKPESTVDSSNRVVGDQRQVNATPKNQVEVPHKTPPPPPIIAMNDINDVVDTPSPPVETEGRSVETEDPPAETKEPASERDAVSSTSQPAPTTPAITQPSTQPARPAKSWPAIEQLTAAVRWKHPQITDENYLEWIQFIRPTATDLKWRKIRWHTELAVAADEARRLQRPLLLWTMNGHPCAET